ncbi:hypothetical protein E8E15_011497 [Penicillium rubens]|nr:hypothetical protein E8E15_011497 [Penicillium rubens]
MSPQTSAPLEPQDLHPLNMGMERRKRTRTGCVNCSRRRRKCDEAKPTCTGCKRRGDECQWRMLGAFRDSNIKVLESDHPSMSQGVAVNKNKRQSRFKILNSAPKTRAKSAPKEQGHGASEQPVHEASPPPAPDSSARAAPVTATENTPDPSPPSLTNEIRSPNPALNQGLSPPYSSDASSHLSQKSIQNKSPCHPENVINGHDLGLQAASPQSHYPPTIQCDYNTLPQSRDDSSQIHNSSPEYMLDGLSGLGGLTQSAQFHSSLTGSYQTVPSPLFEHNIFSDPADLVNDVFLPGSAYEALHTTLRNRQLWTALPDIPNRRSSQDSIPPVHTPVTLDMFDNHRHFASTFPQMAKSSTHLRYSILALSARQLERQQNRKSQSESLYLYQEAIHLLLPELGKMLSCNPKEWRRHLDGCAYLIQAAGINGFSGKEEQALFWCFARMDVCGGLISEEETIIPIHNWRPVDMSYNEAAQTFISSAKTNLDTYANYTVYLVARTLNVLFGCASKMSHPCTSCQSVPNDDGDSYVDRWADSFERVEEWYDNRPAQMKSIFSVAASEREGLDRAFPIALYGNGAANVSCSSLTVASAKAKDIDIEQETDQFSGMLDKYVQYPHPTVITGKAMSHYSEHSAIVEILVKIERETGWATAWRVEDLKEFWGEYDNEDCDVDMD